MVPRIITTSSEPRLKIIGSIKSILAILFFIAVGMALFAWDARPSNHVPNWLCTAIAVPMVTIRMFSTRYSGDSNTARGMALLFLFLSSMGLMVLGAIGSAMRGTWGELLSSLLPIGVVGFGISIIAGWGHFKD